MIFIQNVLILYEIFLVWVVYLKVLVYVQVAVLYVLQELHMEEQKRRYAYLCRKTISLFFLLQWEKVLFPMITLCVFLQLGQGKSDIVGNHSNINVTLYYFVNTPEGV